MQFRFGADAVRITHADRPALMADVAACLADGRGFALATINLDHMVKLRRDAAFRRAYGAQDMVVADGNPVVWLSRLAGRPVRLVPGADLVVPLVRAAVAAGRPVAMVGATDAALAAAAAHLAAEVPGFRAGPLIAPPQGFDPDGAAARAVLAQVAAAGPCLCLVALGAPKQERLAALGRDLAPQAGFAGIGAGVDFLAGAQVRAPGWVRGMALEWLWRMLRDPRRMVPRYAACAAILPLEAARALRMRGGGA